MAWEIQKDFDAMIGLYDRTKSPDHVIHFHTTKPCASDDDPVSEAELEEYKRSVEDDK